ncbi:MAG: ribulose-phosphate 3-epimerase [Neisseriaceae bacterium]|nr:ribulose-phosphate 3-epimerase [Neisseriaceae bacterium]
MSMYRIAPSILSADMARLGEEVQNVIVAGADWIHFDVMDYHYVPNLTFGPVVCSALKPYLKNIPIDVHLMVEPVDLLIKDFANAGANIISFHPEASRHIDRSLSLIREHNILSGLALNPATPLCMVEHVLDKLDMILIMSVNPGFGGQKFIPAMREKIRQCKTLCDKYADKSGRQIMIEVDGGVCDSNIADLIDDGANIFVAGSAVFGKDDYHMAINSLKQHFPRG